MGRFKDVMPSQQGWIHELARAEVHPDAERLLQLGRTFDPQQRVEESTVDFLAELKEKFSEYSRIFNAYSESGTKFQEIKIYSVAQTAADFMIFRNQIKLVVSNSTHGVIQLVFSQHVRGAVAIDGQIQGPGNQSQLPGSLSGTATQDLMAQVGPFRDIHWTFQSERVTADQVAQFYFAEFTRASRDGRRSKAGNQLLLDQIKALLQEKGLNL